MKNYKKTDTTLWTGRISDDQLYLHEKIKCVNLENEILSKPKKQSFTLLGYTCDEGVKRNHGRIGAVKGPDHIRKMLATLSNHFNDQIDILDVGNITCEQGNLEDTQLETSNIIASLLQHQNFPIILGGGHDLAYAHYNGIKKQFPNKKIGIINLDAHFDLRKTTNQGTSGTPFYQISKENDSFNYLCLGIQKASNNKELYKIANELNVQYLENTEYTIQNKNNIATVVQNFIAKVDYIYLTIDLDGFSSALAPGVSAPSPFGFSVDIAMETIKWICNSTKLISADIVEFNPKYDIDNCTARLASRLVNHIIECMIDE
ncbi:formimidoylglutamase [Aquimarina algiphila]|uniref:Formimidoylglutamase n=1 Tax=Aquimarina algiphila TaxID=2047982 RepID=A0A554VL52_9FLAO|nr:formimidoylglutamase [Aquimarina algiphila]TSE08816.1 formimidoylglutamase [Aquimarina algiphila]